MPLPPQCTLATSKSCWHFLDAVLQRSSRFRSVDVPNISTLDPKRVRQNWLSRAASLNTSAHGSCAKNPGALSSWRSISLFLRMRLKCSPRHLSSACTFKCHASGKSRTSLRKLSTCSSKHAQSTTGTSAPPRAAPSPTVRLCTPSNSRTRHPNWLVPATQPLRGYRRFGEYGTGTEIIARIATRTARTLQSRRTAPIPRTQLETAFVGWFGIDRWERHL